MNAYNFENFAAIQKDYFVKPYLFEIAHNAGIVLNGETWRNSFYNSIYENKPEINAEDVQKEQNLWLDFINILGAIWGLKEIDTKSKVELFKQTKLLESDDSQIAKFTHLATLELLALPSNSENLELFIKNLENTELTDNQKFSLAQIIAVNFDRIYKPQYLSEFNPFQLCIDKALFKSYSNVLNSLKIKKHKFSVELLKSVLKNNKTDEKLVLYVFQKIKSVELQGLDEDIAQFLTSENPVLVAKTLMMLPFNEKYAVEFERFMLHMDTEVKTAAAIRMLETDADQKVIKAISILKQEQTLELGKNLWRIIKAEIIVPILLELSQDNLEIFTNIIKRRSDLMLEDSIFDESLEIYKHTEDLEVQADVLKAMLTREDKVAELLVTAAKNKEYKIRHIAWDYTINNPKKLSKEIILALLDADYYKDPQQVLMFIAENPKWLKDNVDVKKRVLKFLENIKEGLEISAVFALVTLEKDAEVASALCSAINKRVLWPVSVQVWPYIKSFT
ncbi:MAG: hypothetical protein KAR20_27395, partial [Candidatus Heimdallarchaeota archaeon]|nr:hypothetical protein [Candidatus Heimdallarchaeota archaeon]